MSEVMHTPSAPEITRARELFVALEQHAGAVFAKHGPYKEFECAVLAAAEIQGWLYVAGKLDGVRRTLKEAIESAASRFTGEFHQPLPACLKAGAA
jgi:hypothetical protein